MYVCDYVSNVYTVFPRNLAAPQNLPTHPNKHPLKISLHEHLQIHVGLLLKLCMHMHVDLCRHHPQIVTVSLEIKSCHGEVLRKYDTLSDPLFKLVPGVSLLVLS